MKSSEAMDLAAGKESRLFPLTNDDRGISRKFRRDFTRIHPFIQDSSPSVLIRTSVGEAGGT
jgi:hypothetical protein